MEKFNKIEFEIKELPKRYKRLNVERTVNRLIKGKGDFYIRRGSECNELIYDNQHRVFSTEKRNFPNDMIFLFYSVQQNCKKFLDQYPFIILPKKVPVSEFNYTYDDSHGVITGTDLDHAFWRIAYVKGYIEEKTYLRGLDDRAKALRLATLAVLGREKKYDKYIGGEYVETVVGKVKDQQLQIVYKDIRYSCYYMMYELSQMLGDDFECWKTDCIYYRDTPKNREIVHNYFNERKMLHKQLVFNSMDSFEEIK